MDYYFLISAPFMSLKMSNQELVAWISLGVLFVSLILPTIIIIRSEK